MEIITRTEYKCGICGKTYQNKESCLECEEYDTTYNELRSYNKGRYKQINDYEHLYYAESVEKLEEYLDSMVSGCVTSYEYEDYDYPCFVIIKQHEEMTPYSECSSTDTFLDVLLLDEYLEYIKIIKEQISENLKVKGCVK